MAIIHLNKAQFEETIADNEMLVFDFWASWCAPFEPIFESLSKKMPHITYCRVNIEEEEALATLLQVRSVPSVMFIREGIIVFSHSGFISEEALTEVLNDLQQLNMNQVHQDLIQAQSDT